MTITTDINSTGLQPTSPTTLQTELITLVAATNPGYTANLPGSLIEDISSTDVGALVLIDQSRVDLYNSISPYAANSFILNQLGQVYGVQQGIGSNTSVYVTFLGSPGYVIPIGFTVSSGSQQFTVQDGGIITTSGQSISLYCLAINAGTFAVPIGTVTQIITSVPAGVTLTCTNQTEGLPGASAQPLENYQTQVINAGLSTAQGVPTFLKTQLQKVSGVQSNLIAYRLVAATQWEIICGGGDPYAVGNAIFNAIPDFSTIVGSTMGVAGLTNANPCVVTTTLNHGYSTGQLIQITGVAGTTSINNVSNIVISTITWSTGVVTVTLASTHGLASTHTATGIISGCTPAGYNGTFTITSTGSTTFTYPLVANPGSIVTKGTASTYFTVTNISLLTFSINTNSTSSGSYISGGVITPNLRNVTVSINNYPDTYSITFVNPPVQTVSMTLTWNTISSNLVSPSSVAALAQPALAAYINAIFVGQPINVFELQNVFQLAVAMIIPATLLSRMVFVVAINGADVPVATGTGLIYGDPESYFMTTSALIVVTQG